MQLHLSLILNDFISDQQFTFLPDCSIHHALLLTNESLHAAIRSHLEFVFMKMDIVKAFDMLEGNFLFQVLKHIGFRPNFISFVRALTSNASFAVLVNGKLTKLFPMTRFVRQGCPLSPLLFIIAADMLSRLFNKAVDDRSIKGV